MPSSSIPQSRKIVIFLLATASVFGFFAFVLRRMANEMTRDAKMNQVDLQTLETGALTISVPPWVETIRKARLAASEGDLHTIEGMLKQGFDINRDLGQNTTLLMLAAQNCRTEVVRFLVQHNASVAAQNAEGRNALICAAEAGDVNTVFYLLGQDKRIDINTVYRVQYGPRKLEKTLLGIAVKANKLPLVRALVDCHANINTRDSHNSTVLTTAAASGNMDIVKFLLSRHADIHAGPDASHTPLAYARLNHHPDIVRILERAGATH